MALEHQDEWDTSRCANGYFISNHGRALGATVPREQNHLLWGLERLQRAGRHPSDDSFGDQWWYLSMTVN